MLYVVVQKNDGLSFDTMVGVFTVEFDAEDFLKILPSNGKYETRKVKGHWGDLMDIRKAAGC
jgi:hypothetical protein